MEKLKAKHDHKLTDILKVAIFGLMLILPGLILLPSMLYYGVNEHATAPTEQVEKVEYKQVDFNQLAPNEIEPFYYFTFENNGEFVVTEQVVDTNTFNGGIGNNTLTNIVANHVYYLNIVSDFNSPLVFNFYRGVNYSNGSYVVSYNDDWVFVLGFSTNVQVGTYHCYINIIDLTQMFGAGNEPTLEQFETWYPKQYYDYTESRTETLEIPTGTYETYTDITSQIQYNWNSLWQQPLFSWTNYTILKQGLDKFTYVFGITQTSYINNLIVYELIMVAIYIVIDIVLTLFKWLTHLIGEK